MTRRVWGVGGDSIPRRSRSLPMRKPTVSYVVVIAHLILCRRTFDHHWRPQLTMRILIAGSSLMLLVAAALLTSFVFPGPRPSDHVTLSANEQSRPAHISIDCQPFTSDISPTTLKQPAL